MDERRVACHAHDPIRRRIKASKIIANELADTPNTISSTVKATNSIVVRRARMFPSRSTLAGSDVGRPVVLAEIRDCLVVGRQLKDLDVAAGFRFQPLARLYSF